MCAVKILDVLAKLGVSTTPPTVEEIARARKGRRNRRRHRGGGGTGDQPTTRTSSGPRIRASQSNPCIVCRRTKSCSIAADRSNIFCRGDGTANLPAPSGWRFVGPCRNDFWHYVPANEFDTSDRLATRKSIPTSTMAEQQPSAPEIDWATKAHGCHQRALTSGKLTEIATELGISTDALTALGVGWSNAKQVSTWPERDASGKVVGIKIRNAKGDKWYALDGHSGLYFTAGSLAGAGRVLLIVEGGTDTAKGIELGLNVVGRPSAEDGLEKLIQLLTGLPTDWQIIVVGENDQRENKLGEIIWPGRDAADAMAANLSDALGRQVRWALPPAGAKDLRAWANARADQDAATLGATFLAAILAAAQLPDMDDDEEAAAPAVSEETPTASPSPSSTAPPTAEQREKVDPTAVAESCRRTAVDGGHLPRIAKEMGVSAEAITALGVGWYSQEKITTTPYARDGKTVHRTKKTVTSFVTIPQHAMSGNVVGIYRWTPKEMRLWSGSKPGMTRPKDWDERACRCGCLLILTDPLDVAAALSVGLAAIGLNPKCTIDLAYYLDPTADYQFLFVNGNAADYAGRELAAEMAAKLADTWGIPMPWTTAPGTFKSLHQWLAEQKLDLEDEAVIDAAGKRLLAELRASALTYTPDAIANADRGEVWAAALRKGPGIYVDTQPAPQPGNVVGRAINAAAIRTSLTVVESHKVTQETAAEMRRAAPIIDEIGIYPARSRENCQDMAVVEEAQGYGLSPSRSVCWLCRFNKECAYLETEHAAEDAPHRIVTAGRASRTLAKLMEDTQAVFLLDEPVSVLAPYESWKIDKEALDKVSLAAQIAMSWAKRKSKELDEAFWQSLRDLIGAVISASSASKSQFIPLPAGGYSPKTWSLSLYLSLRKLAKDVRFDPETFESLEKEYVKLPPNLVPILVAAVTGELKALAVEVLADSAILKAVWKPCVPPWASVISLGASADTVAGATQRKVLDITAGGPPNWVANAVQVPRRITAQARPAAIAKLIRGYLERHRGERLAVLVPVWRSKKEKPKKKRLTKRAILRCLTPEEIKRVRLRPWRGHKSLDGFDRVLALGMPTLPPESLQRHLLQIGLKAESAADSAWGPITWHGQAPDGSPVEVAAMGYGQSAWHGAYVETATELLNRRLAGVHVPVTLVTDIKLDMPLVEGAMPLDRQDGKMLDVLKRTSTPLSATFARDIYTPLAKVAVSTSDVAEQSELPERTVRRRLSAMAKAALVARDGKRGGWYIPAQETTPRPDVALPVLVHPPDGSDLAANLVDDRRLCRCPRCKVFLPDKPICHPCNWRLCVKCRKNSTQGVLFEFCDGCRPGYPDHRLAALAVRNAKNAGWEGEMAELVAWFLATSLPAEPFAWPDAGAVSDPAEFYSALRAEIALGPAAERAASGALLADLRRLHEMFGPAAA